MKSEKKKERLMRQHQTFLKADITEWAVSAFILPEMEVICK